MFYIYADGKLLFHPQDSSLIVTEPKLSLEVGKAGSLQFNLPPTNQFYGLLRQFKTTVTVELDDKEIFRGRVLTITRSFYNVQAVYCEGTLAYLNDSVQKGEKYTGTTHALFKKIIAAHNARVETDKQFTVGEITIDDREVILTGQSSDITDAESGKIDYEQVVLNSIADEWKTTYDYIEESLIDTCGGYLRVRYENGINYIDLLKDYGSTATQKILFGVNLIDFSEEISADDIYTVLIPLGDDNLTIESVNNGSDELVDSAGVETYGRIVKTHTFDNVNKASTLLEDAKRYMELNPNTPSTLTLKAIDMHLIDSDSDEMMLGDKIQVRSDPHNVSDSYTCTAIEYDFSSPSNNTYTFGHPKQTLTQRFKKDITKTSSSAKSSAASSGRSSGSSSSTEAEEATQEALDKFYDAWINVDKETGSINLGAVYRDLTDTKRQLENTLGINLNAPTGEINLYSLKKIVDDNKNTILDQAARIDIINTETKAEIDLVASRTTANGNKLAEITLTVTDLESRIDMKADKVDIDATNTTIHGMKTYIEGVSTDLARVSQSMQALTNVVDEQGTTVNTYIADIKAVTDKNHSEISLVASRMNSAENDIASIKIINNKLGSEIKLKADKVTIDSEITTLKNLIAKKVSADELESKLAAVSAIGASNIVTTNLTANYIKAGSVKIGSSYAATKDWVTEQLKSYAKSTHTHTYSELTNKPSSFPPNAHKHSISSGASYTGTAIYH